MKLHDVSTLWRTLSPRVPSNLFVIAATPLSALLIFVMLVRHGHDPDADAALAALGGAAQVFFAWAIGRELDPDRPSTAVLAVPPVVLIAHLGPANLLALLAALFAMRVLLRPTGLPPRPLDLAGLPLLAAWASSDPPGLVAAVVLGLALLVDARRDTVPEAVSSPEADQVAYRRRAAQRISGVAAIALGLLVAAARGVTPEGWAQPDVLAAVLLAIGAVAGAAAAGWPVRKVAARGDATGAPLRPRRLVRARQLAALLAVVSFLAAGSATLWSLSSLWAALAGLALAAAWHAGRRIVAGP